jgi:hypothetical protein
MQRMREQQQNPNLGRNNMMAANRFALNANMRNGAMNGNPANKM